MRPGFVGKVFDKQSDQKSRIDKGTKEREFTIREQVLVKASEKNQNGLMAPSQIKSALSPIKFSSEIKSGSATSITCIKHKSNVQIAAQMLAKPFREVLIMNESLTSNRFQLQDEVRLLTSPWRAAITSLQQSQVARSAKI